MASVITGVFNTGTGAVSSTVSESGFGFQPKALIFRWTGRTEATDTVGGQNQISGIGLIAGTASTKQYAISYFNTNNIATSDGAIYMDTGAIVTCDAAGAVTGKMSLQTFDSGGFTLVVDDVMPASLRVTYFAIGGTDITADAGNHLIPATTSGNDSVTGLSFQPDMLFTLMFNDSSGDTLPEFQEGRANAPGFGATDGTNQFVTAWGSRDGVATTETGAYIRTDEILAFMAATTAGVDLRAEFTSFNSDGFTLNITEAAASYDRNYAWLAINGGNWSIDTVTTQTDTVTDIVISGKGFTPAGGMVVSAHRAESTADTTSTPNSNSFGVFDSASSRNAQALLDRHGVSTNTDGFTAIEHDAIYANISTGGAIQGLMDVKSMDGGGVTFIMDDADPSGVLAVVILVGNIETGGIDINISPDNVDIYATGVRIV